MGWPYDQLANHSSDVRAVATSLTGVVVVGLPVWAIKNGGLRGVRRLLADHERESQKEAIPFLRKGLQIHSSSNDAECVGAFVEALEILDSSRSRLRSHLRSLRQAMWMLLGMLVCLVGMWGCFVFTSGYSVAEAVTAVAWFVFFLLFAVQGGSVAWQLVERGGPEAKQQAQRPEAAPEP